MHSTQKVLLSHHEEVLVPHLLDILSQIPEITPPSEYENLLLPFTSSSSHNKLLGAVRAKREPDWVEDNYVLQLLGVEDKNNLGLLYSKLLSLSTVHRLNLGSTSSNGMCSVLTDF